MATRLQGDESGKDKWADIDDDEDDWAPEPVEWVDGTKSTVVPSAAPPDQLPDEPKDLPSETTDAPVPDPTTAESPTDSTTQSSTKTILKPGINASNPSRLSGFGGRSPVDKQTLKPSAPVPVKNPWATLPPVDKVAPIFPNPPQGQPSSPFRRDPHGFDSLPPPPPGPAREIAADDFNRSWRDDRGTKELFNSRSGRYEPVTETRRGSVRGDEGPHRQPAVLQRPSFSGPAEPSSAFQSRSSGTEAGQWTRRRASSNVSSTGGRRPSFTRPVDGPEGSMPASGSALESPRQGHANLDHSLVAETTGQADQPKGSAPDQQQPASTEPTQSVMPEEEAVPKAPEEDPVARQQQLMREKIEAAREAKQKQLEEEQKQESAKKERLRMKMEALAAAAPSPELKESKAKATAQGASRSPQAPKQAPVISPPKPPIPTSEGEVAQYGMMKVHQAHPVKKANVSEASMANRANHGAVDARESVAAPSVARPEQKIAASPSSGTNTAQHQGAKTGDANTQHRSADEPEPWRASPGSSAPYTWVNNSANSYSAPSNVWGPPPNIGHRPLGNGTFNAYNTRRDNEQKALETVPPPSHLDSSSYKRAAPPAPPRSSSNFPPAFPQQSPNLSQSSQLPQQQNSNPSSNSFTVSTVPNPNSSSHQLPAKMGGLMADSPVAGTFADAGQHTAPVINVVATVPEAPKTHQEAANAPSFQEAAAKAANITGGTKSGRGMAPVFQKRYDWNLSTNASTEQKANNWNTSYYASHDTEKAERVEMFAKTTVFTTRPGDPSAVQATPSRQYLLAKAAEEAKAQEAVQEPKGEYVPPHLRVRKSKFQPLFEGQLTNAGAPAKSVEPAATDFDLVVGDVPSGSEHLFSQVAIGIKIKLPNLRPSVKLPPKDAYDHLKKPTKASAALPSTQPAPPVIQPGTAQQKDLQWQQIFNCLVHDPSVTATTKTALVVEPRPARVTLSRSTVEFIAENGPPSGLWASRFATPQMRDAYFDWKANVKPTDEELFEEPQFASRPLVCAPKKPHMNAHLAPVHVANLVSPARVAPLTTSATALEHTPFFRAGAMEIRTKLPGAAAAKTTSMRSKTGPVSHNPNHNHNDIAQGGYRGNNRRNFSGRGAHAGFASNEAAGSSKPRNKSMRA